MENSKKKSTPEISDHGTAGLTDWMRKTLLTGVGAVFMTEEGIRNALSEMKMPKNVIASAVAQADRTKKEVTTLLAKEVRQFLDGVKVEEIIKKVMTGAEIEIKASIRFVPKKKARD